jgi:hypothetical protein
MSDYTNEPIQLANDLSRMLNEYLSARASQETVELSYLAVDGVKTVKIINPHYKKPKTKMFAYLVSVGDGVMGPKYAVGFEDHEGRCERRAPWLDGEVDE